MFFHFAFCTFVSGLVVGLLLSNLGVPSQVISNDLMFSPIAGIIATLPINFRTSILKRWCRSKNFDWFYRLQTIVSLWVRTGPIVLLLIYAGTLFSWLIGLGVFTYGFIVGLAIILVSDPVRTTFAEMLAPEVFAVLCMKNYLLHSKDGLDVDRGQLSRGLVVFEELMRDYGVQVPHEKLALAINTSLIKDQDFESYLNSFSTVLANPNRTNLAGAIDSAARALRSAKENVDLGFETPYSRVHRLFILTPATVELLSSVISLIVAIASAILLFYQLHPG